MWKRRAAVSPLHLSTLLTFLALLPAPAVRAQETGSIAGVVTAQESGSPVWGARVSVAGTPFSATADAAGRYTITGVPPGTYRVRAVLIGYSLAEAPPVLVTAGQTVSANFQLKQLAVALQEVVAVGYGTQVRRDVTGSVAGLPSDVLDQHPAVNSIESIKGRVPGVDVVTTGTKPGDGVRVRVRGDRSLKASNDPLYVLDGIPMAGGIGDLDPNDIESMEVLKDASATAIYGSRGANGVVLITSRHGRAGPTTVTYDVYAGYQQPLRRVQMMNGPEFAEHKREANRTVGRYRCPAGVAVCDSGDVYLFWPQELTALRAGISTDWQDLVLQEGAQVNNEIGVAGGNEWTRFALSASQLQQQGIVKGQDFRRRSMRLSLHHELNPRLHVESAASLIRTDQSLGRGDGVYSEALGNDPLGVPYDSAGNVLFKPTPDGQRVNPLSDILNWKDERARTRLFGTLSADYDLAPGLNWRLNFGADLTFFRRGQFRGAQTQVNQGSSADAQLAQTRTFAYTVDNILTYRRSLGSDHRLDATLLYSIQQERTERDTTAVSGLPYETDQFYDLGSAVHVEGVYSGLSQWALQSVMARANYTWKDRYLLTVSGRLDGSSRLAPGHKYALFPSVALAWRLSEEPIVRRTGLFSDLKLRASFGRTGNTAIDPYQTEGQLVRSVYSFGDKAAVGYGPGTLPNPDLRWEKTSQVDVGLEFTAVNNRLAGTVDVYRANTSDLIMLRQIAPTSGYTSILQNIGATRNTGLEVALSAQLLQDWNGLGWSTQLNWAANRNRIVRLFSGMQADVGNLWFVGQPIQVYYDYKFAGIWQLQDSLAAKRYKQVPGQIRVVDVNGDGKIDAQDKVILGTNFPEWTSSFTNRFDWRGFDLSATAYARVGFMVNDQFRTDNNQLFGRYNNLLVNYWTPTNPSNTDPRPNADQEFPIYGSTRGYEDGSFIRVRDITLGYTVPGGRMGPLRARSLRIYATALDPFLFTKFGGLDPESRTSAGTPSYRTVLMGVTVGI